MPLKETLSMLMKLLVTHIKSNKVGGNVHVRVKLVKKISASQSEASQEAQLTVPWRNQTMGPAFGVFSASFSIRIASCWKRSMTVGESIRQ
jgi:hypothetical protein